MEAVEHDLPGDQPRVVTERAYQIVKKWHQWHGNAARLKELEDSLRSLRQQPPVDIPSEIQGCPTSGVVGRSKELEGLLTLFHPPSAPRRYKVVMLHGIGGIGKSELAKEYCRLFSSRYPDGIFYFYVYSDETFHKSLRVALISLGLEVFESLRESWESFKLILKERRECLLLYDSADKLETIEQYLPVTSTSVHVLITSRSSNSPEMGTDPPTMFEVRHLSQESSVDLLLKHSGLTYNFSEPPLDHIASREYTSALALVGRNMIDGYTLALTYAGKHIGKRGITIEDYVCKLKRHSERVRVKINNLHDL